jgi:PIN domain nuclease of toxin-antitoxin system
VSDLFICLYLDEDVNLILIAQAQVENIPILTVDRLIVQYPVQTTW